MKRSSPKTILVIAMACGGGLMLGLGLAIMRDLADRVIRTSQQAEALLNSECIATLPLIAPGKTTLAPSGQLLPPRTIRRDNAVHWNIVDDPFSPYTEGLRSIKAAIDHSNGARTGRVIGLSSALANEGKSTVAASLALLAAQTGARTILVDGDLRNPTLSRLMAASASAGTLEVLTGTAALDDMIWIEPVSGMHLLPTVLRGPMANSSEILGSDVMSELIASLAKQYDYVIVDLSPLAPVIDVRSTGRFIQQYLLVVEWGKTHIELLDRALARAPNLRDNLVGVVLNKADTMLLKRYEGYDPSYYTHSNYGPKAKVEA